MVAAACLGVSGCATTSFSDRSQLVDLPLASLQSDIVFTLVTGSRIEISCLEAADCPSEAASRGERRFALQVQRIAERLQKGAEKMYPDVVSRSAKTVPIRFDVYVADSGEPGSGSSANGRIALNAALGNVRPGDELVALAIAREMGHVIARHHEENSGVGMVTSLILNVLIPGTALFKSLISAGGSRMASSSKQDLQSIEADAIARKLLEASGFRLSRLAKTRLIVPGMLDDGTWSKSFRTSFERVVAHGANAEISVALAADKKLR